MGTTAFFDARYEPTVDPMQVALNREAAWQRFGMSMTVCSWAGANSRGEGSADEQFKAEQEQAAMQKVRRLEKRRSMTAGNLSNLRLISSGHFSW